MRLSFGAASELGLAGLQTNDIQVKHFVMAPMCRWRSRPQHQSRKWRCTRCESVRPRITDIDRLSAIVARMRRDRCIKPTRTESDVAFSAYTENPLASGWRGGAYQKGFLIALRIYRNHLINVYRCAIVSFQARGGLHEARRDLHKSQHLQAGHRQSASGA